MTDIDTDKLGALDEVMNRLVATLGRIPEDSPDHARLYLDMTLGEGRETLAAILAMAEENKRLRDCLGFWAARQTCEEALADTTPAPWRNCSPQQRLEIIRARKELHDSEVRKARRALGKEPKA